MAFAEPHANLNRQLENIAAAVEGDREAMEAAEAETRRATRKWRQYTVWLAHDSNKELPRVGYSRRLAKAKLVWWASKKAGGWRDIDRV